jgi:long-chain acyl-CoA synthetase
VFTAVPRVWEKFYSGVMIAHQGSRRAAAGRLSRWSVGVGSAIAERVLGRQAGAAAGSRSSPAARAVWSLNNVRA